MASVSSNLRSLTKQRPIQADWEEIARQLHEDGNDRGAAILASTLVEHALFLVIARRIPGAGLHYAKLFEDDGMFASFDARVTMASVLDVIGELTLKNLRTIKHIRNTFAHASVPVTFATREVVAACDTLTTELAARNFAWSTPKEKFVSICSGIAESLEHYAARCHRTRADFLDPATMVPLVPATLP